MLTSMTSMRKWCRKMIAKCSMLTHCGTQPVETSRLILRPFLYSDDDDMLAYWISDPLVQRLYCEPVYRTKLEVKALLDQYINAYTSPETYRWAVIEKLSGKCIGQVAYFLVDTRYHFAELEYCIGTGFQRRGYATEAARAAIEYGFSCINLHKVQICHMPDNAASRQVILNCHCTYEGALRDYFYEDGRYADRLYYSVLRSEWEKHYRSVIE